MAGEHYFSEDPSSPARLHSLELVLSGKPVLVKTASGTFSAAGLDRGTDVLLRHVPLPPARGVFVDVGSGWGAIAMSLAIASPEAEVWAVDVNLRARELTAANARANAISTITAVAPDEYPEDKLIDLIWSNPPIRIGKPALHQLLTTWLNRLTPDGEAWLVVNKNLGADTLARWIDGGGAGSFRCERIATDKGFRVLRVRRH